MKSYKDGDGRMFSNFPPGAANQKNAPYNQEELEIIPWEALQHEDCGICGAEAVWCNEDGICEVCYEREPKYYEEDDVIFDKGYEEC